MDDNDAEWGAVDVFNCPFIYCYYNTKPVHVWLHTLGGRFVFYWSPWRFKYHPYTSQAFVQGLT